MKKSLAMASLALFAATVIGACTESPDEDVSITEQAATNGTVLSGSVTATLTTTSDWGAGFCQSVSLKNTGSAVTSWTLNLATNGASISNIWNATQTTSGTTMTVTPASHLASIPTNGTVEFGFCGTGTGRPTLSSLTVNGGTIGTGGSSSMGGATATGGTPSTGGTSAISCSGAPLSGGTVYTADGAGTIPGGYSYELWHSGSAGVLKTTIFNVGAAFKVEWNNPRDFVVNVGLKWDETKTYDQYGTISADYAYTKAGTAGGYSDIGFYGWSNNPLVEYFIIDDWFGTGTPYIAANGTLKGNFNVDGGTYKIYTRQQVNKPSIHGTQTFQQFISVRQTPRQCGHISVTEHFKQWKSLGMNLGKMYEGRLHVDGGGGTGTINYTGAAVTAK
jgi:hypothetical protein